MQQSVCDYVAESKQLEHEYEQCQDNIEQLEDDISKLKEASALLDNVSDSTTFASV